MSPQPAEDHRGTSVPGELPSAPSDAASLHQPVLLAEVLAALAPQQGGTALDCTLGMGGHALALVQHGMRLTAIDRDPQARAHAAKRLADHAGAIEIIPGRFGDIAPRLAQAGRRFDAVLADLGVSSMQLDDPARGFSIRSAHPADMRMGDDVATGAVELISSAPHDELAGLLRRYGEVQFPGRIAAALQRAVAAGHTSAAELADAVRAVIRGSRNRHPAIPVFQALRIAVNDELGELERLLAAAPNLLNPAGRIVIISFHSLEDRLVKTAFRLGLAAGRYAAAAKHVVTASRDELARNRRAAAAKLRWAASPGHAASTGAA